jgi:hypothetical protein
MFARVINGQIVSVQPQTMCMFDIPFAGKKSLQELKSFGILPVKEVMESCSQYQEAVLREYIIKEDEVEAHYDVVPKDAHIVRRMKEESATIEIQGHPIKLTDKAIYNLQAYILSGIESVSWKCDDDVFITVSQEDMQAMLVQLMTKKNELFEAEMLGA